MWFKITKDQILETRICTLNQGIVQLDTLYNKINLCSHVMLFSRDLHKMLVQILILLLFSNQLIASQSQYVLNLFPDSNYTHLQEVFNKLAFTECISHLQTVAEALMDGDEISLKMLDATAHPQSGLLFGNLMHVGNYDECLEIQGKYCTAMFGPHPKYGQDLSQLITDLMKDFQRSDDEKPITENARLSYGFCVPKVCTAEDLQNLTELIEDELQFPVHFSFVDDYCDGGDARELTQTAIFAIAVFSIFGALLILGTLYEYFVCRKSDGSEHQPNFLMAFSLISNGRKLLSTSTPEGNLNCLNGLRVLSMMWILLTHGFLASFSTPHINARIVVDWQNSIGNSFIIASSMAVDTFFVISGLLVTYLFLKHQSKGGKFSFPMFYIHRLLRLTPSLAMVILFTTTLLAHLGKGPFWNIVDELFQKPCERNWWSTLTYFQIYINPNDQCVGQAWYLAVDTEMYFISPLILFPLVKWPKQTIGALVVFIVLNCSYVFEVTWKKHLGTTFFNQDEAQYNYLYSPTHVRGTAYLVGMICGYFVYQTRTTIPLKLTKSKIVFLWIASLSTMIGIILGHYSLASSPKYEVLESSIFNSLTRVGWSISLSIVILLCVNDYGGAINSFLSSNVFTVLIRLNYSVYLLHLIVLVVVAGQERTPKYFSNLIQFHRFWGDYFFLLGVAFIWTLTFESPVIVIEKILFGKRITIKDEKHLDRGVLADHIYSRSDRKNILC